ncbi:MAG TPA: sugar phosphate isomerase/epimerase [Terriglobales bacterium]|nr:sugar phosphate isomerase/epimerase [Terriglobales bacterium]
MQSNVELLASYWTISCGLPHTDEEYSPFDFRDRVESASRAGFTGFGIWHADLERVLRKYTIEEMKQIFDDNGIRHIELEFLGDWFLDGKRKEQSDIRKELLLDAAEALQAHHVKVGDFRNQTTPMDRLTETFGELCADAAECGTKVGFELMPFCMIPTLEDSLKLVQGAGASNGGICLDAWHLVKMKVPYDDLRRIPSQYITSVELNDGTFECPWSLHEDTVNHRRFCGEGEFDVKGFIAAVQEAGYRGPWGIEVLSEEARKWPLEKLTSHAFETTMAQFSGESAASHGLLADRTDEGPSLAGAKAQSHRETGRRRHSPRN